MKNKKMSRYMIKMFFSFFLVIGIPVAAMTSYFYYSTVKTQTSQQQEQSNNSVKTNTEIISTFISRANDFVTVLDSNSSLWNVKNTSFNNSIYSYKLLLEQMSANNQISGQKTTTALYIPYSGKVLSTNKGISDILDYSDYDLIAKFFSEEKSLAFYQKNGQLIYVRTLPKYNYDNSAVFLFYMDLNSLFGTSDYVKTSVVSQSGDQIYGDSDTFRSELIKNSKSDIVSNMQIGDLNVSYQTEPKSGWIIADSYKSSKNNVIYFNLIAAAVILIVLVLVCLVSYFFTNKYSKPVRHLSKEVEELSTGDLNLTPDSTIFDEIEQSLDLLKSQNSSYKNSVEQSVKIVKENIIRNLLHCRVPEGYKINEYMQENNIDFSGDKIIPILIRSISANSAEKLNKVPEIEILVKQLIDEHFSMQNVLLGSCLLENNISAFLLNGDKVEEDSIDLEKSIEEVAILIKEKIHLDIKSVLGNSTVTPQDLNHEFINLRRQILVVNNKRDNSLDSKTTEVVAKFPPYLRANLLSAIKIGDVQATETIINKLYLMQEQADESNKIITRNYIYSTLGSVLVHIIDAYDNEALTNIDIIDKLTGNSKDITIEDIRDIFMKISESFNKNSNSNDDGIYVSKAKQYISQNIGKDISMTDVAQHIGINTSYLGRIFKVATGITPLQYITNLRIDRAKELLRTDSLTVADIAETLGYNDKRSFIRYFKKLVGCTPSEYRIECHAE